MSAAGALRSHRRSSFPHHLPLQLSQRRGAPPRASSPGRASDPHPCRPRSTASAPSQDDARPHRKLSKPRLPLAAAPSINGPILIFILSPPLRLLRRTGVRLHSRFIRFLTVLVCHHDDCANRSKVKYFSASLHSLVHLLLLTLTFYSIYKHHFTSNTTFYAFSLFAFPIHFRTSITLNTHVRVRSVQYCMWIWTRPSLTYSMVERETYHDFDSDAASRHQRYPCTSSVECSTARCYTSASVGLG